MAAVKMFIDKFKGVVKIDEDHPLAVAQREKDAKAPADDTDDETVISTRMTVAELTELCEERGIEVPEGATKKDMVALLEAAD